MHCKPRVTLPPLPISIILKKVEKQEEKLSIQNDKNLLYVVLEIKHKMHKAAIMSKKGKYSELFYKPLAHVC